MYENIKLLNGEKFLPIRWYKGKYSISNFGMVYGFVRKKLLNPLTRSSKRNQKYLRVNLIGRWVSVHRIVAEHFIENPMNKETINHFKI